MARAWLLVEQVAGDDPARHDVLFDRSLSIGRRRCQEGHHRLGIGLADVRVTGGRHDAGEREHPIGMLDRHDLHDHPAHRCADDVRGRDVERIEQADGIVRHGRQRVRRLDRLAFGVLDEQRHDVRGIALRLGRQPDVTVVESDHPEPAIEEFGDEARGPQGHLGAQPHDQQQRGSVVGAEALVTDLDVVHGNGRHDRRSCQVRSGVSPSTSTLQAMVKNDSVSPIGGVLSATMRA